MTKKMPATSRFYIQPCIEVATDPEDGRRVVVLAKNYEEAEFFGVYERLEDGTSKWMADFDNAYHASLYRWDLIESKLDDDYHNVEGELLGPAD